jgi:hypothetical protein
MRRIATTLAVGLAWAIVASEATYRAGLATGRAIHRLNDWLAGAIHDPTAAAERVASASLAWASAVIAPPEEPGLLELLGAELLTDEQLDAEIAAMPSIADTFAAAAAEMAASDARLYRAAGERIGNIRQILDQAEPEAKPVARRKPARARKAKAEA